MVTARFDAVGLVVAVVLGLLFWLPAAWVAGRKMNWTVPAILATAFSLSSAVVGIAAVTAWLLKASLTVAIGLSAAGALVLLALAVRFRRGGTVRVGAAGIIVGLLAGGLAFWERPWFAFTADTFYHLAAARSLIVTNAPLVTDPLHKTGATGLDPTSGVFHTFLAGMSRVSDVGVEYVYTGFAALAAAALIWALWALAERVSGSPAAATLTAVGFAAFGVWGDFRMAGMPNRFGVAFLCVALLALIESTTREKRRNAALVASAAGAAALLTHLAPASAIALFLIAAAAVTLLFGRRLRGGAAEAPTLAPLLAALLVSLPVAITKVGAVLASPMTGQAEELPEAFVWISAGLLAVKPGKYIGGGPTAFVLMAVIAAWAVYRGLRDRDGAALTLAAFLAVPLLLLGFPPVTTLAARLSIYMIARIALMLKFLPFVAAAWALGTGFSTLRDRKRPRKPEALALVAAGIALLVAHGIASWPLTQVTFVEIPGAMRLGEEHTVAESREKDVRGSWGLVAIWAADREFRDTYPIVAASPETGYYLAGLTDVAIVAAPESHTPLAVTVTNAVARRHDMAHLLDPAAEEHVRREILDRWNADYVALSLGEDDERAAWDSMVAQPDLFQPVVDSYRFGLLRVVR